MRFPRNEEINGRVAVQLVLFEEATTRCSKRGDASSRVGCRFYYIFPSGKMAWGEIISKKPFSWKITHIMSQYSMVQREKMNNFRTHTHKTDASSSPTLLCVRASALVVHMCVNSKAPKQQQRIFFWSVGVSRPCLIVTLLMAGCYYRCSRWCCCFLHHTSPKHRGETEREMCLGEWGKGPWEEAAAENALSSCTIRALLSGRSLNIWKSGTSHCAILEPHRWVHA